MQLPKVTIRSGHAPTFTKRAKKLKVTQAELFDALLQVDKEYPHLVDKYIK